MWSPIVQTDLQLLRWGWPWTPEDDLDLPFLLLPFPKCWLYKHERPHQAILQGSRRLSDAAKPWASCGYRKSYPLLVALYRARGCEPPIPAASETGMPHPQSETAQPPLDCVFLWSPWNVKTFPRPFAFSPFPRRPLWVPWWKRNIQNLSTFP